MILSIETTAGKRTVLTQHEGHSPIIDTRPQDARLDLNWRVEKAPGSDTVFTLGDGKPTLDSYVVWLDVYVEAQSAARAREAVQEIDEAAGQALRLWIDDEYSRDVFTPPHGMLTSTLSNVSGLASRWRISYQFLAKDVFWTRFDGQKSRF